jgi:hypothetical protein
MARQTLRFVVRRALFGVTMRVVASNAVKGAIAGDRAAAPRQGGRLKTDPEWIIMGKRRLLMMAMALAAESDPGLTGGVGGANDRRVGKLDFHGLEMIATGSVAALAADTPVAGLWPDVF